MTRKTGVKIETVPLSALKPDTENANRGAERGAVLLERSLSGSGFGRSLTLDKNLRIINGNHTTEGAAALGFEDVVLVHTTGKQIIAHVRDDLDLLTDKQAQDLAIFDNAAALYGISWDAEVLALKAKDGINLEQVFFPEELAAFLAAANPPEPTPSGLLPGAEPDAIPETVETRCKFGDIWQLGRHRVACMSALEPDEIALLFGTEKPAMVFSDPPYGISVVKPSGFVGGGEEGNYPFGGIKNRGSVGSSKPFGNAPADASNVIEVGKYAPVIGDKTTETAIKGYEVACSLFPKAVQVWWGGNYYAHALPPSSCWIVWDKQSTGDFPDAELAWTNQKTPVRIFAHMWNGLMKASEKGVRRVHPTQKPVALAEWVYEHYGKEQDLIFDPFLGSGMSVIAAETKNRTVYGTELSPDYCDIVLTRWETATGEKAVLKARLP